jgi:hypothetical protein
MARHAIDGGAHLVVGHHPHVIQPIEVYRGVPIVYSVGNLAFDQTFPETFPAIVVEARLERGRAAEVAVRPIYLEGFTPRALAGDDAVRVLRDLAARSAPLGALLDIDAAAARATVRAAMPAPAERVVEVSAPLLHGATRRSLPVRVVDGAEFVVRVDAPPGVSIDLARPLLPTGLDDGGADDVPGPLGWTIVGAEKSLAPHHDGGAEVRLRRSRASAEDSTVRSSGRLQIAPGARLTLAGRFRRDVDAGEAIARLVLFADREVGAEPVAIAEARGASDDWRAFSVDLVAPPAARYVQVQLVHAPPTRGREGVAAFAGVELLEWSGAFGTGDVPFSPATHLALQGAGGEASATVRLSTLPRRTP